MAKGQWQAGFRPAYVNQHDLGDLYVERAYMAFSEVGIRYLHHHASGDLRLKHYWIDFYRTWFAYDMTKFFSNKSKRV